MPNPKPRIDSQKRRAPTTALLAGLAVAALGAGVSGCEGEEDTEGLCVSTEQFFAESVWAQTMATTCIGCHNQTGAAKDSSFVLAASSEAGYLEKNLGIVKDLAATKKDGRSILLAKPTGSVAHEGGKLLETSDQEYKDLERLVQMLEEGNECQTNEASFFAGIELGGPRYTLRKMTLAIAARVPTDAELAAVDEKGFDAFGTILDQLMTEEPFYDRLRESYNNLFLTDQYMNPGNGVLAFLESGDDEEQAIYDPLWWEGSNGDLEMARFYGVDDPNDLDGYLERQTVAGVAREPLELIVHVVRNNKPFSEVLTADYMMVNPFSSRAWLTGLTFQNEADPNEWLPTQRAGVPLAGVLTSIAWLNRHPTTPTNRNRHRARMVYYDWLGTDILKTAERPLDPTKITDHNPTMNNPACVVCHDAIDPPAGAFAAWGGDGEESRQHDYVPEFVWYQDMRPPGFGKEAVGFEDQPRALSWLAQRVTNDPRFAVAVVYQAFRAFVGQEPMLPPTDPKDPEFKAQFQAYLGQYYTLSEIAENFKKSNYNFKQIVKDLVMSPYFRAVNTSPNASDKQVEKFGEIGTAHLLTPEELNRKIENVLGITWRNDFGRGANLLSDNRYRLLYGGINSEDVTNRIKEPNGVMANVIERMGNELACRIVPSEFAIPAASRRFFGGVEATFAPRDGNGFEVSSAVSGIKENIRTLHYKILGEDLAPNDPEVERTYQLFLQVWDEGQKAVAANEEYVETAWECGTDINYLTGEPLDEATASEVRYDALYTKRAWMAVFTYLITDYKFVHE